MSKDKAVDYFDRHKESEECHITSDGRVFHTIGSASGFANTLKDNKVTSYTREGVKEPTKIIVHNTGSEDEGSEDESKNEALEALKNFDASVAQYSEIKALVKALGLETENQKQETLVAALEAHKAIINTVVQE